MPTISINVKNFYYTNKKNDHNGRYLFWQPQPDSNWCSRLERAVSWASRRWGQNCLGLMKIHPKRRQIITGILPNVKGIMPVVFIFVVTNIILCLCLVRPPQELQPHQPELLRLFLWFQPFQFLLVQLVGKLFLYLRRFSALNGRLSNHMFPQLS